MPVQCSWNIHIANAQIEKRNNQATCCRNLGPFGPLALGQLAFVEPSHRANIAHENAPLR